MDALFSLATAFILRARERRFHFVTAVSWAGRPLHTLHRYSGRWRDVFRRFVSYATAPLIAAAHTIVCELVAQAMARCALDLSLRSFHNDHCVQGGNSPGKIRDTAALQLVPKTLQESSQPLSDRVLSLLSGKIQRLRIFVDRKEGT